MNWPSDCKSSQLDRALKTVMQYLFLTGQAQQYQATQLLVGQQLVQLWRRGARHPIRLANDAIVAIETYEPVRSQHRIEITNKN